MIIQAQELIENAIQGTPDENHFSAYGKYGLDQLLGNGNPHDSSLYDLIYEEEEYEYEPDLNPGGGPYNPNDNI